MNGPIRALLLELADELDHNRECLMDDRRLTHPLADRGRALAAAPPEPQPVGEVGKLVPRLRELADAVTTQSWSEFSMRVPAEPLRDADLVLARAAALIEQQAATIAALAAAPPEPVGELVRFPFTVEQLRDQWNAQADEFNQWESLGLDEQIGWAQARAAALIEQQAATIAALQQPDRLRHCPTHGQQPPNAWACPECLRELREAQQPVPGDGEGLTDEDRELLEAFYLACQAEGGTADEIHLRGLRAAIAADRQRRAQPPQGEEVG